MTKNAGAVFCSLPEKTLSLGQAQEKKKKILDDDPSVNTGFSRRGPFPQIRWT